MLWLNLWHLQSQADRRGRGISLSSRRLARFGWHPAVPSSTRLNASFGALEKLLERSQASRYPHGMTLTLDLPPELERDAVQITDLKDRLLLFVRQQVDLERWRSKRYSSEAQRLVAASASVAAGMSQEEATAGFLGLQDRIASAIKD
jgi:hypothetical protein